MKLRYVIPFFLLFNIGSCVQKKGDTQLGTQNTAPPVTASHPAPAPPPVIETYFSPGGECEDKLVERIGSSRHIRVLAYSFTSEPIITALVHAHSRTHDVQVVLDRSNEDHAGAKRLIDAGVPTRFDRTHAIAHQKVMVFDEEVEEGSFNFSASAESKNSENCNFFKIASSVRVYSENWKTHWEHSVDPGTPKPASRSRKRKSD